MKIALSILLVVMFLVPISTYAQEKPLTQAEYVKLLYALDKNFAGKDDIIALLRTRGIDFEVTDGVRSLTRSKGRNNDDLKQALEEAGRRKAGGIVAKALSEKEAAEIISKTRAKTLEAVEDMPDFVVKQQIQRSAAFAGTGNFRNLDRLVLAVSYRSTGYEEYRILSLNGVIQNKPMSLDDIGGATSTGEFVNTLRIAFRPESDTIFQYIDTDEIRGRKCVMFDYEIEREKAEHSVTSTGTSMRTGTRGRIWIDKEIYRVLRIESVATGISEGFPIRSARNSVDYDWTTINGEKYLLPLLSDVRITARSDGAVIEKRNYIRFRQYQKYGTDVTITAEDDVPANEVKP